MKAVVLSAAVILAASMASAGTNSTAVVMAASIGKDATWRTGRDTYTITSRPGNVLEVRKNLKSEATMWKTPNGYTVVDSDGNISTVYVRQHR